MLLRRLDPIQSARDISHGDKTEERLMMLPSVFLSHGLSYNSQETLFQRGAPALRAIQYVGTGGLGSRDTIANNISRAVKQLEVDLFRPQMRLVTTHKIPLAVLMDGSSHKGR